MHIGEVAKQASVTVDAIRFYERSDILARAPRTAGGFRVYGDEDVAAVRFVQRAQRLGFTLPQIRELLALRRNRVRACVAVRDRLQDKLGEIHAKIRELQQLDHELRAALRNCDRELRKRSSRCPLFENPSKPREASR